MKKIALIVILLLSLLVCLSASAGSAYQLGDTIEDFSITTPNGEVITLSALLESHKAVLINFWFVDCPWCVYEFPYLQEAYEQMGDEVAVLALTPYDSNEAITAFQQENGLTFTMAQDNGLAARFGCTGYPTSVMIDRFGVYCFGESGAFPSTSAFMRLFSPFAANDYSGSLVGFEIPAAAPPTAVPSSAEISAALNAENSAIIFAPHKNATAWPWLIQQDNDRTFAYPSNSGEDSTSALITATVSVQAGDALQFDYMTSSAQGDDVLALYVNNVPVKIFSGENAWSSYAHSFSESGDYELVFAYMKNNSLAAGDDTAGLDNIRLLSGEAAQAALSLNPPYPKTLSGTSVAFDILNEGAREVVVYEETGVIESLYPTAKFYVTPGEELQLRVRIGTDIDPDAAMLYSYYDGSMATLISLKTDEDGYLATVGMDSLSTTGYAWSLLFIYPIFNNYEIYEPLFYFASEEELAYFCQNNIAENTTASWAYADENVTYTLKFTDQYGNPVPEVIVNICSATSCAPMTSDENGLIVFENVPYAYDIHVLKIPYYYDFDLEQAYTAPVTGGEMSFTITKE